VCCVLDLFRSNALQRGVVVVIAMVVVDTQGVVVVVDTDVCCGWGGGSVGANLVCLGLPEVE